MKYKRLGTTDLEVSQFCLGTMTFGDQVSEAVAETIIDTCWEAGVNFFDTADVYGKSQSEEILGKLIRKRRHQAIIATKVASPMSSNPEDKGLSRSHIMNSVDGSLRRLKTDYIDLYQSHLPDFETPIEETLRAFDDLVRQGKVRYVGCSNYSAQQLVKAIHTSDKQGIVKYISVQPRYNLLDRQVEEDLLPLCVAQNIGVIPYNPLAGGLLTGKYHRNETPPETTRFGFSSGYRSRYWHDVNFVAVDKFIRICQEVDKTPAQMALAWLFRQPAVTAPIVGTSAVSQVSETLEAVDMVISDEELDLCQSVQGVGF